MKNTVIIELENWAKSQLGHSISLTFSGANKLEELKNPLLLIGGVHGDEPEGVYLALATLKWLRSLTLKELNSTRPWALVTCINPDGYSLNQRTNSRGVDINRNFPAKNWSAEYTDKRYFPGPFANSEIENQKLTQLIETIKPQVIIHCHSWKPCIVRSGPPSLDEAQHLSHCSGFEIVDDIGYATPGSLSSYAWQDMGIPVICIEDSEHRDESLVWPRFKAGIQKCFFNL